MHLEHAFAFLDSGLNRLARVVEAAGDREGVALLKQVSL
jgi:hypothetical protein